MWEGKELAYRKSDRETVCGRPGGGLLAYIYHAGAHTTAHDFFTRSPARAPSTLRPSDLPVARQLLRPWGREKIQHHYTEQAMKRWNLTAARLHSTVLLLRTPVITADLPPFQQQYYKYQRELWKRLMWTFPKWYYIRDGTLLDQKYRELNKNPIPNNPALEYVGGRPEIKHQRDRRFKQEILVPKTYDESDEAATKDTLARKIVPNSRTTEADRTGDKTSLERSLARTLHLIVSRDNGKSWTFPSFEVSDQPLHHTAEEGIYSVGGRGLNYHTISPKPCHVVNSGENKHFFIKLHILSGTFEPNGISHLWLTKDELAEHLDKAYFDEIAHLISDV